MRQLAKPCQCNENLDASRQTETQNSQDVEKALKPREESDRFKLLSQYHGFSKFLDLNRKKAGQLLPHWGPQADHHIDGDVKGKVALWGLLYNMSREELLVLRKMLTKY